MADNADQEPKPPGNASRRRRGPDAPRSSDSERRQPSVAGSPTPADSDDLSAADQPTHQSAMEPPELENDAGSRTEPLIADPKNVAFLIINVYRDAMIPYFATAMQNKYGETWFTERVIAERETDTGRDRGAKAGMRRLFYEQGRLPVQIIDTGNFADIVKNNSEAFEQTLNDSRYIQLLRDIQRVRNSISHPTGKLYSVTVKRLAENCATVMTRCGLVDAAAEVSAILQNAEVPSTRATHASQSIESSAGEAQGESVVDDYESLPETAEAKQIYALTADEQRDLDTFSGATQDGPSGGGGGSGAATLAGAGDEDGSLLVTKDDDRQETGKRWRLPIHTAIAVMVVAVVLAFYLIATALPGGSPPVVAPAIDGIINCEPTSPRVGGSVRCHADLSGGEPDSWFWSINGTPTSQSWSRGDRPYGDRPSFKTTFSSRGSYELTLTVANDADDVSKSFNIKVLPPRPTIKRLACSPENPAVYEPTVREPIICTAPLGGGAPDSWSWSGGDDPSSGDKAEFTTVFSSPGSREITLTVANDGGPDSKSLEIQVLPLPPTIKSEELKCLPEVPKVGETVECSVPLGGGDPDSWRWSGGGEPDSRSWNRDDPPYGDQPTFETTFSSPGSYELTLTVANDAHRVSASHNIEVLPLAPTIKSEDLECLPATPKVGDQITCSAPLGGGDPDSWTWSGGGDPGSQSWNRGDPPYGDQPTFETTFSSPGSYELTLAVENTGGDDSAVVAVQVRELPLPPPSPRPPRPPVIDEISCEPASPMVGETVSCSAELGGDEPDSWLWSLNGNPTSQSWKRGDPPYGDQPTFETTFSSPGLYELTLAVENDADRVSALHNIEACVQPNDSPSPPGNGDEMDPPGFDGDDMMGSERFECDGVARQGSEGGSSEDDMMGQGGFDNSGE